MSNKSTATAENALTQAEIDEYLNRRIMARMATHRADGYPHLTPIWFVWENGKFLHTLGAGRVHLANLARDPRMSSASSRVIGWPARCRRASSTASVLVRIP